MTAWKSGKSTVIYAIFKHLKETAENEFYDRV